MVTEFTTNSHDLDTRYIALSTIIFTQRNSEQYNIRTQATARSNFENLLMHDIVVQTECESKVDEYVRWSLKMH